VAKRGARRPYKAAPHGEGTAGVESALSVAILVTAGSGVALGAVGSGLVAEVRMACSSRSVPGSLANRLRTRRRKPCARDSARAGLSGSGP